MEISKIGSLKITCNEETSQKAKNDAKNTPKGNLSVALIRSLSLVLLSLNIGSKS